MNGKKRNLDLYMKIRRQKERKKEREFESSKRKKEKKGTLNKKDAS